jgi:hypothetical protein
MASEFLVYLRLGLTHIADLAGYDHILFIAALTAGYVASDWRRLVWLVTAFTLGHSITLALATLDLVRAPARLVEALIPLTILVTAGHTLMRRRELAADGRAAEPARPPVALYALATVFGLVHGLGFSSFLRRVLGTEERIGWPLFAFNVGLEVGQLVIVGALLLLAAVAIRTPALGRTRWIAIVSVVAATGGAWLFASRVASA